MNIRATCVKYLDWYGTQIAPYHKKYASCIASAFLVGFWQEIKNRPAYLGELSSLWQKTFKELKIFVEPGEPLIFRENLADLRSEIAKKSHELYRYLEEAQTQLPLINLQKYLMKDVRDILKEEGLNVNFICATIRR